MSLPRSVLFTQSMYAATAVLVVIGLALQLVPSTGRLEAGSTNVSTSLAASRATAARDTGGLAAAERTSALSRDSTGESRNFAVANGAAPGQTAPQNANDAARIILPGEFQAVVVANIFSPDRAPPRTRYRPRGTGQAEAPSPPSVRNAPRRLRLFGVTLHANGAVALIDADPAVPGAEIYRVGDSIAGGRLVEIGAASVVIERRSGRQTIRLETEPSVRERLPRAAADSLREKQ
jgi:hypothetical protein